MATRVSTLLNQRERQHSQIACCTAGLGNPALDTAADPVDDEPTTARTRPQAFGGLTVKLNDEPVNLTPGQWAAIKWLFEEPEEGS